MQTSQEPVFIGIDIAKDSFDIHVIPTDEHWTSATSTKGIGETIARLKALAPSCITLEATGGLELPLTAALAAEELPAAIINPRHARDFARAMGVMAKTDAIDARVLAMFGAKMEPPCRPLPSEEVRALRELVVRRAQLVDMRTMEVNHQKRATYRSVGSSIATVLATIEAQIKDIDREIGQHIKNSPVWRTKAKLLQSVPGVGSGTTAVLMAALPELGTLSNRQAASLAGLAPMNRDSGLFRGRRMIAGGRGIVRKALYMPTLIAIRYNPVIKALYERLRAKGKPAKLAITACMRKLLVILNAIVRDNVAWNHVLT